MRVLRLTFRGWMLCGIAGLIVSLPARAEDWLPVAPEDLQMTREPKAPGAPAIYLYRQIDRDDQIPQERLYVRLKILTDEGRKYADVEIPYIKSVESVRGIEARTIRPDGTIARFDGTVYEKPIVSARGVKLLAKAFTMPDVEVGCIIEYRYSHSQQHGLVFDSHWILSQDLFTRYAKFSLDPYPYFPLSWSWPRGLPEGSSEPKRERSGKIRLEARDVPAFVTEEFMPPENELKFRVDFIYLADAQPEKNPAVFWKTYGKRAFHNIENFVDKRAAMEKAVAQIVQPGDSAEVKLRKIYARTQQVRNESFERQRSEQELERDKQSPAKSVEELWKRGSGDGLQITWLFLALARAAGVPADPALVSTRDLYFFDPRMMNPGPLNSNLVIVKLNGQDLFLDPGIPFTPFGLLPWSETAVGALRLDKDGGSWINTPLPAPSDSRLERKATLALTAAGTLEGKVTITFTGLEAAWRRLEERHEDDTDRKQFLEDQLRYDVPSGIDVSLTNTPDWASSDAPLVAEFHLKVPGWAAAAGQRQLVKVGLFGGAEERAFKHASRIQPLYFNFPYQRADDVTIDLPKGRHVTSTPKAHNIDLKVLSYKFAAENQEGGLHLKRDVSLNLSVLAVKFYPQLRDFFQSVRSGDEEQVVLSPDTVAAQR